MRKMYRLQNLGEVYCSEKSVESRCRAMIVKRIRGGGKQRESRLVGNVMGDYPAD